MTIQELLVEIGFKFDTMKLKDLGSAIADLNLSSVATALGIGALYEATEKIMNIADKTATSIYGVSTVTGLTNKQVQQFSGAIESMGGNADEAQASLKGLQSTIDKARLSGATFGFYATGIMPQTASKDLLGTMQKIQDFLKNSPWDNARKMAALRDLGLSEGMAIYLRDTKNLSEEVKKATYNEDKQILALHQLKDAWGGVDHSWTVLMTDIGSSLAPMIKKTLEWIDGWITFADKSPQIQKIISEIAHALIYLATAITAIRITEILWGIVVAFGAANAVLAIFIAGIAWIIANQDKIKEHRIRSKEDEHAVNRYFGASGHALLAMAGNQTVHNDIDFVVHAAANPLETATIVGEKIGKMLSDRYREQSHQVR